MAIVKYNALNAQIDIWLNNGPDKVPPLFLIYGESYLVKKIFDKIRTFLTGPKDSGFALEVLEGGTVTMGDIIEEVSTFSFLDPKKIIAVKKIPLFASGTIAGEINFSQSDHTLFADFISKGIPENHFLILTCQNIDKRKKIYKSIEQKGLVIDCSIAQGARKADLDEQTQTLKNLAGPILKKAQKTLGPQAFPRLVDLTGFNLELFSQNLGKLIAFSGKNKEISLNDVNSVIVRDKKDPIFLLTNAVMDQNTGNSLFYLNSLLENGFHPLQILKTFENQIRKLVHVKCFLAQTSSYSHGYIKKSGFNGFKQGLLSQVVEYDKITKSELEMADLSVTKEKRKKKKAVATDLFLAPNPKNPYPVFQVFLKSEKFSLTQLNQALIFLSDLDYKLKSSAIDARTQLENFIINLCNNQSLH